ncbi:MAG: hypothetical protein KDB66_08645 [Solirubrobacterales bacterium]|nr:hypothetical protein [Solirubrobacterales bacterium]
MTNRITSPAVGLLLGLVLLLGLSSQQAHAGTKVPVQLRIVTFKGKIVFDRTVRTGTAKVKPNDDCLGGRTGPARTVAGATGIGLLAQASMQYSALKPLTIADSDYGFGVCGIGGIAAQGKQWWSLYNNFKSAPTGAEGLKLKKGDSVLFYLAKTYEQLNPDLLYLNTPAKVRKGVTVKSRVMSFDSAGKKSPVEGAKITGGASDVYTDPQGYARVKITGKTRMVARKSGLIPSNRVYVSIRK